MSYEQPCGCFLRVASSIVNPFGGSQSFIIRAPVEETGIDMQRIQQVGGGPDHSDTQGQDLLSHSSAGTSTGAFRGLITDCGFGGKLETKQIFSPVDVGLLHHSLHPVIELEENHVLKDKTVLVCKSTEQSQDNGSTDLQQTREPQQRVDAREIVKYLKRKQTDDVHLENKQQTLNQHSSDHGHCLFERTTRTHFTRFLILLQLGYEHWVFISGTKILQLSPFPELHSLLGDFFPSCHTKKQCV